MKVNILNKWNLSIFNKVFISVVYTQKKQNKHSIIMTAKHYTVYATANVGWSMLQSITFWNTEWLWIIKHALFSKNCMNEPSSTAAIRETDDLTAAWTGCNAHHHHRHMQHRQVRPIKRKIKFHNLFNKVFYNILMRNSSSWRCV